MGCAYLEDGSPDAFCIVLYNCLLPVPQTKRLEGAALCLPSTGKAPPQRDVELAHRFGTHVPFNDSCCSLFGVRKCLSNAIQLPSRSSNMQMNELIPVETQHSGTFKATKQVGIASALILILHGPRLKVTTSLPEWQLPPRRRKSKGYA